MLLMMPILRYADARCCYHIAADTLLIIDADGSMTGLLAGYCHDAAATMLMMPCRCLRFATPPPLCLRFC